MIRSFTIFVLTSICSLVIAEPDLSRQLKEINEELDKRYAPYFSGTITEAQIALQEVIDYTKTQQSQTGLALDSVIAFAYVRLAFISEYTNDRNEDLYFEKALRHIEGTRPMGDTKNGIKREDWFFELAFKDCDEGLPWIDQHKKYEQVLERVRRIQSKHNGIERKNPQNKSVLTTPEAAPPTS